MNNSVYFQDIVVRNEPLILKEFENHLSVLEIKKQVSSDAGFSFSCRKVTLTKKIIIEMKKIDESKAT